MGQLCRRRLKFTLSSTTMAALAFLLITSVSALSLNPTRQFTVGVRKEVIVEEGGLTRRRLGGPGSWPPTCRSKCGRCSPCKPVHVPIQPSLSIPLEYYPEAWRCKCGNNLFMP
ncbi:EPIDERMAL PATTERNING FACTOR-like protein 4 [Olea europaea var. sylvestris]|uniref:EPIDERMAL PATTERNING FACTOR-like protein 4 n=1 Tax=Olea europaea var. sylvestris TaxID=158386 RepID=UPI000C1D72E8|nr:EPIDERMAL PATTERNING FACTOR-like protein 4 [Olea europaea var. sylvestris]